MLFNSLEFAVFLIIVFSLYWFVAGNNFRVQNVILLASSYLFYGWWDYRFLFLLIFSTFLDYFTGLKIHESDSARARKVWLYISVLVNLGFLGLFKYYNFFIESFTTVLDSIGFQAHPATLSIILPVGISFYTFHGLSYVFDIYNKKITPTRNFVDYSLFVSFFPLLVAGPIERATHLLPQVQQPRKFDESKTTDGLRQILWGLFKKIVIADNCAVYVNDIFTNYSDYSGSTLVMGAFLFAFQIYGDFSGYSDVALGTAKLFGFSLLRNFAFPYFSRDIAEFWRRWHISLSSWFRDYLYIPLGGNKGKTGVRIRNTFLIFLVSGFWHGANWTFIFWGILNAAYFLPLLLSDRNRSNMDTVAHDRFLPSVKESIQMASTFLLVTIAWVFFRSASSTDAFLYLKRMFSATLLSVPEILPVDVIAFIVLCMGLEWLQRKKQHALEFDTLAVNRVVRWSAYYCILFFIFQYGGRQQDFIYFQF